MMGYTHSWYREMEINPAVMARIATDFACLMKSLPKESEIAGIPYYWDGKGDIAFTGKTGGCEPMMFCRISPARRITPDRADEPWKVGKYFEYCKTETMPYDLAATSLLLIVKRHLADKIRVFSDGNNDKWKAAFDLCQLALGYGIKFSIKGNELSYE
jgi:hypothetical protein